MDYRGKWVHVVGICGVATGQMAVELLRKGAHVTGSDKGIFPPMSDFLKDKGIFVELGYKSEHLEKSYYDNKYPFSLTSNHPDLVIIQGSKGNLNIESIHAKKLGLDIRTYPEIIKNEIIKPENSIVVAGTYGKTTTTSMLVKAFEDQRINISYMFGGISNDLQNGVKFKDANTIYSIVEGDEYLESSEKRISKFFSYSPKYLIINGIEWDHTDIFKTKNEYVENFKKLVIKIPHDGIVFYNSDDKYSCEVINSAKCKIVDFSSKKRFNLSLIGEFNQNNANATYTLCRELGLDEIKTLESIESYKGIRRRLEIRYQNNDNGNIIIDDFGASPSKAVSAISSIANKYPGYKIIVVFEPNLGSRTIEGLNEYRDVFTLVDKLILPRFTNVPGNYISNKDLAMFLESENLDVSVDETDGEIIENLKTILLDSEKIIVAFMGSHGFRGMIESLISSV